MTNDTKHDIIFPLLTNGFDFIYHSLEILVEKDNENNPRAIKYALLALSAGVELILKEPLRRKDWKLVFEDITEADEEDYKQGNFYSIKFKTCIKRLRDECGIKLTKRHKHRFQVLRTKRNQLEHFGFSDTMQSMRAAAASALNSLIDYISLNLMPLDPVDESLLALIREKLGLFVGFVDHRWDEIRETVDSVDTTVVDCPHCSQEAVVTGNGADCAFCGYKEYDSSEAADTYITSVLGLNHYETVKDGGEWPHYDCPSCDANALVDTEEGFFCFGCGEKFDVGEIRNCDTCCEPYFPGSYEDFKLMCNNCLLNYSK